MQLRKPNNAISAVCILTSAHPSFDTRIWHKEAKSLAKAGYEVSLVAQYDREEIVDGIRIIPLSKPKSRLERMTKTVWMAYRKAIKIDADIYHFHDPELIPAGLLLKLFTKAKVIRDVHEDYSKVIPGKHYLSPLMGRLIAQMFKIFEEFTAKRFDCVVTATPFINGRFLELGANAVNVNNYPLVSELYNADNQWEEKEKAACYVGAIAGIRGAFEMVEAIGKTKCKLLLAGDFEPGLENRLRWLSGWRQVEVLGFVGREDVRATVARSIAGMVLFHPVPNHIDAQPNKMYEYMSAGIPVIASNFPLWREIIEGAECGICVDPHNPDKIAEAIRWIIECPAEAEQMGKNGRKAVKERYNWGVEEKKLLDLYKKLLQ